MAEWLQAEGWRVDVLADGEQAVGVGLQAEHDMAVLDVGLPRKSGMEVLREWRARGVRLPVLLLTARDQLADRVAGLDAGADDYLVKPFDLPELLARLRALRRRAAGRLEDKLTLGGLELDLASRELRCNGQRVPMSPRAIQQAPFRVLVGANMPAVLVEMGFITNPEQEKMLVTDGFQTSLVQALVDSVIRYRDRITAGAPVVSRPGGGAER